MLRYLSPQSADVHTELFRLSAGWFTTTFVYSMFIGPRIIVITEE